MDEALDGFLTALEEAADVAAAWDVTIGFFRDQGFDIVCYGLCGPTEVMTRTTLPEWYERRYAEMGYSAHDPSLHHCLTDLRPAPQGLSHYHGRVDGPARQLIDESAECGLRTGIVFPTRGTAAGEKGALSASNAMDLAEFQRFIRGRQAAIHLAAVSAHTRLQILRKAEQAVAVHLRPRERECLLWSAAGLGSKDIARRLGVSPPAIDFHMAHACRKLSAATRTHAVARALALGMIAP